MTRVSNPKETIVAINASGGAVTAISASKSSKYVEIQECPPQTYNNTGSEPFAPQGLLYTKPDDNFVTEYPLLPGEILPLGDNSYRGKLGFGFAGATDPAGNSIPATVYIKAISATSTATQVRVREWS
jgi:hypothetical protein